MRMTKLATIVSSVLFAAASAQAGDYAKEDITAADKDGDGMITLAEAQAGAPKLAEKFASVDANGDGKLSSDELKAHHGKSMEADEAATPPTDK
jgi:Ca2+-binding EF-hand superfamily protein